MSGSTPGKGEPSRGATEDVRPEAWTRAAFAYGVLTLACFIYLGSRPGGAAPVWIYRTGLLVLGSLAALFLALALGWCAWRRPALQRGRLAGLVTLAGVLWLTSFPLAYPSSHQDHPSRVAFRLPFEGEWRVGQGGEKRDRNVLVLHPSRRFGWQFEAPESGRELLSPADGTVHAIGAAGWVLRVAEGQFLVLEGVESVPGSSPAPGDSVLAGDRIGTAVGVALIVSLQDQPSPGTGEGIPMDFRAVRVDGQAMDRANPHTGQAVAPDFATSTALDEAPR